MDLYIYPNTIGNCHVKDLIIYTDKGPRCYVPSAP